MNFESNLKSVTLVKERLFYKMAIRVLIADDHPLIADGIKNTFTNQNDYNVVGIVHNGQEALDFIRENVVDIILLDIDMPVMDGIQCAEKIVSHYNDVKIAMLSMHQEKSLIQKLIKIGVKGYMLKTIPSDELLLAVKTIYNGKDYFNADVTKALISDENSSSFQIYQKKSPLIETLTSREIEIIKYLSQGFTNANIGEKLFISPRTVDTHRTNIMRKIDVHNVASLIRFAFQNGLTS